MLTPTAGRTEFQSEETDHLTKLHVGVRYTNIMPKHAAQPNKTDSLRQTGDNNRNTTQENKGGKGGRVDGFN